MGRNRNKLDSLYTYYKGNGYFVYVYITVYSVICVHRITITTRMDIYLEWLAPGHGKGSMSYTVILIAVEKHRLYE